MTSQAKGTGRVSLSKQVGYPGTIVHVVAGSTFHFVIEQHGLSNSAGTNSRRVGGWIPKSGIGSYE